MSILIHDGRRSGHMKWSGEAIRAGVADGVILSPFHSPRVKVPFHRAASEIAEHVSSANGEVIFDAMTHARLENGSNLLDHYDTWPLWSTIDPSLGNDADRLDHIERVFAIQRTLNANMLAPNVCIDSPNGVTARTAFRMAQLASGLNAQTWQSLPGSFSFWSGGNDLDAFVGQLASLRAPCWVLTVIPQSVDDSLPNLADTPVYSGLLRTIHSLSQRSRVILAHADYSGLPAVAAGATSLGAGWDRAMRTYDKNSFRTRADDSIRIPASYVTQGKLGAVLKRQAADAIQRLDAARAQDIRGGKMPSNDAEERHHHLRQLRLVVGTISGHGKDHQSRVDELRSFYEIASRHFVNLRENIPASIIDPTQLARWVSHPYAALKHYAEAENLWSI